MFYIITDGMGTYISQDPMNGKFVTSKNHTHAKHWDNLAKANAVLNNSIPKKTRGKFAVQIVEVKEQKEPKKKPLSFTYPEAANIDDNIKKVVGKIDSLKNTYEEISKRKEELAQLLSETDKKVIDIEHFIEFRNLNCYEGWKIFKLLQTVLKERRSIKNELEIVSLLDDCDPKFRELSASELLTTLENRSYTPRVLKELFQ